jgi:hypothetical protein
MDEPTAVAVPVVRANRVIIPSAFTRDLFMDGIAILLIGLHDSLALPKSALRAQYLTRFRLFQLARLPSPATRKKGRRGPENAF